jgi:hypothetical protein
MKLGIAIKKVRNPVNAYSKRLRVRVLVRVPQYKIGDALNYRNSAM